MNTHVVLLLVQNPGDATGDEHGTDLQLASAWAVMQHDLSML